MPCNELTIAQFCAIYATSRSGFAPNDQRLQQVEVAERLISEIDPQKVYTYEYICFRITGYRPDAYARTQISGADLLHDLHLFVEDLSDATEQKVENIGEQVLTVEELAKQFNVSTKTISRWRQQGLVSRRFVFDGRSASGSCGRASIGSCRTTRNASCAARGSAS